MVSIMLIFVFLLTLSSALFELKSVEICFYNSNSKVIDISQNKIYNTQKKVDEIINTTNFDYGQSLFLTNSNDYTYMLESKNPYLKVLYIESLFPNKLLVKATERQKLFYISSLENDFIFDSEYKILEKGENLDKAELIKFEFQNKSGGKLSFFDFFEISSFAFDVGQFLTENNLVFDSITNCVNIINSNFSLLLQNSVSFIIEEEEQDVNFLIKTKGILGVSIEIEDLFNDFDKKFTKVLQSLQTIYDVERVKTTYGKILIDKNCNCFWYNM